MFTSFAKKSWPSGCSRSTKMNNSSFYWIAIKLAFEGRACKNDLNMGKQMIFQLRTQLEFCCFFLLNHATWNAVNLFWLWVVLKFELKTCSLMSVCSCGSEGHWKFGRSKRATSCSCSSNPLECKWSARGCRGFQFTGHLISVVPLETFLISVFQVHEKLVLLTSCLFRHIGRLKRQTEIMPTQKWTSTNLKQPNSSKTNNTVASRTKIHVWRTQLGFPRAHECVHLSQQQVKRFHPTTILYKLPFISTSLSTNLNATGRQAWSKEHAFRLIALTYTRDLVHIMWRVNSRQLLLRNSPLSSREICATESTICCWRILVEKVKNPFPCCFVLEPPKWRSFWPHWPVQADQKGQDRSQRSGQFASGFGSSSSLKHSSFRKLFLFPVCSFYLSCFDASFVTFPPSSE